MRGTPKELLIELVGEEEYETYARGDPIRIQRSLEDNDNFYTIERKRGYADIVRTRRVRVSDSSFYSNYGIRVTGNYFGDQRSPEPHPQPPHPEERFHIRTDSGRLKAWNIDDAVASFIVAVKNGEVNWGCGNIDVRLPSSMPPTDLGVTTFIRRGIGTALYGIIKAIEGTKTGLMELATGNTRQMVVIVLGWWAINLLAGVIMVPDEGNWVGFWSTYLEWTVIKLIPLYLSIISTKHYFSWKNQWEVKMS